uniref:GST C-terminal domain-containing protein n=1 Tax=Globisporangium ultimum (strain ATCC 200006 / CBS 805.95 / DAOM BR144) TaxID=431595 RepID=K3X532_GLOUD
MAAQPYRHYIQPEADADFPAEAGRYHLYVTYSCPFACRALAARNLKGLQDVIGLSVAHPIFQKTKPDDASDDHLGWTFVDPAKQSTIKDVNGKEYSTEGCIPDTVLNTTYVRDIYELVSKEPRRYTVPLLWDKKKQTIVSNESADILRTLNTGFRDLVSSNVDLLPEALVKQIEELNDGVVNDIAGSLFKIVLAKDEETRLAELNAYFSNVQRIEEILLKSRFLVGNSITEADVRLFHALIRFDVSQRASDKSNLTQYPNVVNYLRELYQTPALKSTVNWEHLKVMLVNFSFGVGTDPSVDYEAAHNRATRFAN